MARLVKTLDSQYKTQYIYQSDAERFWVGDKEIDCYTIGHEHMDWHGPFGSVELAEAHAKAQEVDSKVRFILASLNTEIVEHRRLQEHYKERYVEEVNKEGGNYHLMSTYYTDNQAYAAGLSDARNLIISTFDIK